MQADGLYADITQIIIARSIRVHDAFGPGLMESAYQPCLVFELADAGLKVEVQKPLPLVYRNVRLDCAYRLDLVVQNCVIVEVKAIEAIAPIHTAQMITYLKLSGLKVGLILNFNVRSMRDGIKRVVLG